MEAAHIAWRPLGRLLVEQGLLANDELERALARQQTTGKRLGETIVELGFVSGPDLANALATQYGIELTMETGFGTGLRAEIQRRHENDRGLPSPPTLSIVATPQAEPDAEPHADDAAQSDAGEALLLTQLEEQWAKLAAAEARLEESEREIAALTGERDHRRKQAARLVGRVRERERQLDELGHAGGVTEEHLREIARLASDVEGCDTEIDRLRQENGRLREQAGRFVTRLRNGQAQPAQDAERAPVPASHLVFVQLNDGYELVESEGPPPALHTVLELPQFSEDELVVTRLGRSPLPADARSCVFVQRA